MKIRWSFLIIGMMILPTYLYSVESKSKMIPERATINQALEITGEIRDIVDPCIIREGNFYYVYSTGRGIRIHRSMDMLHWTLMGFVFNKLPKWAYDINPYIVDLWAPDISYYDGKYHLYYAASVFGQNQSAIGLASNVTLNPESPKYEWTDEGIVIQSHPGKDNWNALDPNLIMDEKGDPWLDFGSYWSGIKMRKVDLKTGLLSSKDTTLYSLASRQGDTAIEGPFIIRHKRYYYLFVSFDHCCQGANSNYNVRVGRSPTLLGPYVDKDGIPMLKSGGTLLVESNQRWKGTGHNGILLDKAGDKIVYHAYDANSKYVPTLRIVPIQWDSADWPVISGP